MSCAHPFKGRGAHACRTNNLGVESGFGAGPPGPTDPLGPLEGEEEEAEAVEPEVSEGRPAKPMRAPALPSPEEVEAHYVSHILYRAWCSHCVRARKELCTPPSTQARRPRGGQALFSHLVPAKGVEHFYPEHALARDIRFLGYPSVVLKSDQESSIKALAEAVKNSFAARDGVRVQLENSPKGDDHGKSNGEAEAAVEITQGLCRTYKDACEKGLGEKIHPKSPLLGWLVEHAGCSWLHVYTVCSRRDFEGWAHALQTS